MVRQGEGEEVLYSDGGVFLEEVVEEVVVIESDSDDPVYYPSMLMVE